MRSGVVTKRQGELHGRGISKKTKHHKIRFKKNLIKFLFKKLEAVIQGNWLKMEYNYLIIRSNRRVAFM